MSKHPECNVRGCQCEATYDALIWHVNDKEKTEPELIYLCEEHAAIFCSSSPIFPIAS